MIARHHILLSLGLAMAFAASAGEQSRKPLLIGLSDAYEPAWSTNIWPTISGTCLSYVDAIGKVGHVPIILCRTENTNMLDKVMSGLDLLILTGGCQDVDPALYDEPNRGSRLVKPSRDRFDFALLDIAKRRHIPVLGICRGIQIMNVYFGGSLCQDIPSQWEPKTTIRHGRAPDVYAHTIDIAPDSRLAKLFGGVTNGVKVTSEHHQCVKRVAPGFRIVARSPDGVIEAIEHETLPFAGVQFHPEASVSIYNDPLHSKIYRDPFTFIVPQKGRAAATTKILRDYAVWSPTRKVRFCCDYGFSSNNVVTVKDGAEIRASQDFMIGGNDSNVAGQSGWCHSNKLVVAQGVTDFPRMRKENAYFVDRTALIPELEKTPYALFLRPRRFGKSLLCAILKCYYALEYAGRFEELFGGSISGKIPRRNMASIRFLSIRRSVMPRSSSSSI